MVHVARNPLDASVVAEFLKENGVEAFVDDECLWGVQGEAGVDGAPASRVFVRDEDHPRAERLLAERWVGGAADR
jgi:hypothetical protein